MSTSGQCDIRSAMKIGKTNFYAENSARKRELDERLALCLSIPHMSINIFTNDVMSDFIKSLDHRFDIPKSFNGLKKFVSISNGYYYLKIAHTQLDNIQSRNKSVITVANNLKEQLEKRFRNLWDLNSENFDPTYLIAAALDPSIARILTDEEITKAAAYMMHMIKLPSRPDTFFKQQQIGPPPVRERSRSASGDTVTVQSIVNDGIKKVLACNSDIDPITFWSSIKKDLFPMRDLAYKVLAVPCTSAAIERVWSKAGAAIDKSRGHTEPELLNMQLMVYMNNVVYSLFEKSDE